MLSKFCPESKALLVVVSDFFRPRWLIAVMLNYRSFRGTYGYHLNIKEIDHIVFITKMVHVMFHETAHRKLLVFTLYVNPYMSNGVSHFNLLDELITWSDATVVMWRLIWVCTVWKRPSKWRQGLNELNITPRMLEITSRNFRKCKNLECNLKYGRNWDYANPDICPLMENVKFYWKLLWTAPTYTYSYKDIRFETLSNVERMVVPGSHANGRWLTRIWVCLSNGDMWKGTKMSCWFYYRIPSLRRDGCA